MQARLMKWWPIPVAVLALLCWDGYKRHLAEDGALREREHALLQRNAKLEDESGRIDTLYIQDTVRLNRDHIRYVALRDTLTITDTVQVRELITQADSTIAACSVALQTCEQRVAIRDSIIGVKDSLLAVKDKRRPGWIARTFGCTAGLAMTPKGAGIGASCGVRIP